MDVSGLAGSYDFALAYSREIPNARNEAGGAAEVPDLSTALREQLGLQLVARKLPFQVVVVDAVDRLPVEN